MSDISELGVLYTEHSDLRAAPLASLWSYDTQRRGASRRPVARNRDGNHEYWLERCDPLLNTILPGTGVSLVVNFGEQWAAGRSLATSALLPRVCIVGPVTQARILRVGTRVQAIGAVLPPTHTEPLLGVPAAALLDQIVALEDLWHKSNVEALWESLSYLQPRRRLLELRSVVMARTEHLAGEQLVEHAASRLITLRHGRVSIEELARTHGVSRKQFAHRFSTATGMTPKLFARVTRFQSLVHVLLSSDVSEWASVAPAVGFYDQSHMINEFRAFAGSPPTVFFQPHRDAVDSAVQFRGRPHEWRHRTD